MHADNFLPSASIRVYLRLNEMGNMSKIADDAFQHLNEIEQDCVRRFVTLLYDRLGDNLYAVWLFGSAARGDMWGEQSSLHSDVDLLVIAKQPVAADVREGLVNETYSLYLECGRQIAPQFKTKAEVNAPASEQLANFLDRVRKEGKKL